MEDGRKNKQGDGSSLVSALTAPRAGSRLRPGSASPGLSGRTHQNPGLTNACAFRLLLFPASTTKPEVMFTYRSHVLVGGGHLLRLPIGSALKLKRLGFSRLAPCQCPFSPALLSSRSCLCVNLLEIEWFPEMFACVDAVCAAAFLPFCSLRLNFLLEHIHSFLFL